jgi:hypothetical protein
MIEPISLILIGTVVAIAAAGREHYRSHQRDRRQHEELTRIRSDASEARRQLHAVGRDCIADMADVIEQSRRR